VNYKTLQLTITAAWPRGLKRRFYGDLVITIAQSWLFSSHCRRTRCCVFG